MIASDFKKEKRFGQEKEKHLHGYCKGASPAPYLPIVIYVCFMEYKKWERRMPVCLECGDKIRYGRKDKKFCCDDCRNRHYNAKLKQGRTYRRKVLALLDRNYELLDDILKSGRDSADFTCLMTLGFNPDAVTFCHHSRRHDIYGCFDITYKMSEWRIYSISKIQNVSLPLQADDETKHQ